MARVHKLTHPWLGAVSWKELQKARERILEDLGRRVCSWCHREVPKGRRTRCGLAECREKIWQITSWSRCRTLALRRFKWCDMCGSNRVREIDHVVPVSLGGTGDYDNLRGLCVGCHKKATARLRKEKEKYVA